MIENGFKLNGQSSISTRCLQILSSSKHSVRFKLYTETNFINFIHDFPFNLSNYSKISQQSYFYVLPNIMVDDELKFNVIFDEKYFSNLFKYITNDYAFGFIIRLIKMAPSSVLKILKKVHPEKIIVSYLCKKEVKDGDLKEFLRRSQFLFTKIMKSKISGNICSEFLSHVEEIVKNSIKTLNASSFTFLAFIDD